MQAHVRARAGDTLLREARAVETIDLEVTSLRELNQMLHGLDPGATEPQFRILNPRGRHAIAVGVDAPTTIEIDGNVGYYCAGMNKQATVVINGSAGVGGKVDVSEFKRYGSARQLYHFHIDNVGAY